MKTWEQVIGGVVSTLLTENMIEHEIVGDNIHTALCTIEFTGTPNKPEYWVNEVRIARLSGIVDAVQSCIQPEGL